MGFVPISDLSSHLVQTRRVSTLRSRFNTAAQEVSTGRVSSIRQQSKTAIPGLFAMENRLAGHNTRLLSLGQAAGRFGAMSLSLERVSESAANTGPMLLSVLNQGMLVSAVDMASRAEGALETAVTALNMQFAGQHLFSGAATGLAPLPPASEIVDAVGALLDAAPDVATGLADVEAFFSAGGGFETSIYRGATAPAPAVELAEGQRTQPDIRADDPAVRNTLKSLALAAAAARDFVPGEEARFREVARAAAVGSIGASQDLVGLAQNVGAAEAEIAAAMAWSEGAKSFLELRINDATSVDPFEAAAQFEALSGQLEMTYAVTARVASLRLLDFLR